ncbi:MAG: S-layer homology domain-containing protein [Scytonematopsis contorta HA4267-MV1]|jgi:hypothetical protein|nr:S-layer homology domain-containing protein [Scytonematopsis contorta HA4267-MV1]
MKNKNQRFLTACSQAALAMAYVAMVSPMAYAASGFSTTVEEKAISSASPNLLAVNPDSKDLPENIKASIFEDISRRTSTEISSLRLVRAEKTTWANSCLGLNENDSCSRGIVPGWQVVVADKQQMWVYRTDKSGEIAKLDEASTQAVSATMARVQSVSLKSSSSTVQRETLTVQQRSSQSITQTSAVVSQRSTQTATNISVNSKKPGFTLAIWQPSGSLQQVTARISLKAKRGKGYAKERFLGDYKYKLKSKAKFTKGLKAGDRVVVRLYDTQNRFIGYSEFECLSANTAVNLVLSANPTEYKVVRTVYGLDTNFDGEVDSESKTYNYFSQINGDRVTFFNSERQVRVDQFQVQDLSSVPLTSVYPVSFTKGEFALASQSIATFSSNLAAALKATPGSLVQMNEVSEDSDSTFDVSQLMMDYREVGVASNIRTQFTDVSTNHWAKDFIAELAALEIIDGFPDGTFRPDEQVTRAQFAAMINQGFEKAKIRNSAKFKDVSRAYWAYNAIQEAYQMGFFNSAGSNRFNPTQALSRLEVMTYLAQGLNYTFNGSNSAILAAYTDADSIRSDVRNAVAALTERGIIVNYPNIQTLNADKVATRAEVCALLYKALVSAGEVTDISSEYAVEAQKLEEQKVEAQKPETETEQISEVEGQGRKPRRNCNQGIGNGSEGCDPGNSRPHGGSNDEGGRTPGNKK